VARRAELGVEAGAAVVAVKRLAVCDAMAIVAIAHRFLQERLLVVAGRSQPD